MVRCGAFPSLLLLVSYFLFSLPALADDLPPDREGALVAFDSALELTPDNAVVLHNRGVLHLQEGRPEDPQVVTDLQRAKLAVK